MTGFKLIRTPAALVALLGLGAMAAAVSLQAQGARVPTVDKLEKVGGGLYEVAFGESTDSVYVASTAAGNRKIFVLDPRTLAVKSSIDVEAHPAFGIAFNNRTQTLYTSNTRSNNITAIDARSGKVLSIITSPDGGGAHGFRLLVDEEANLVYISLPGNPSRVWIVDGATNTLKHEIKDVGQRSTGLALDKANNRLFVASIGGSEILEVNLATNTVARRFPSGGQGTTHLAYDAESRRLFAGHQQSGNVTVLNPDTAEVLKTIPTGAGALGLGLDAKNHLLYVANRQAGTVTAINSTSLEVVANLQAGTMPNTVAIDQRTGDVYVTFKARPTGRGGRGGRGGAPAGAAPAPAPAAPAAPAPVDEGGDTVARIVLR
jgi:YVTN family beta-propeller protein